MMTPTVTNCFPKVIFWLAVIICAVPVFADGEGENPEVTVIMPAWNREAEIRESIESVRSQTFTNWELIIVDDASVDGTLAVAQEYAVLDPRVKVIALHENQGVSEARNVALDVARGRYIAFLDSDDLWRPRKLEIQLRFMKENDYAFTFTGYDRVSADRGAAGGVRNLQRSVTYEELLHRNTISPITVMLDKNQILDIYFRDILPEDLDLWLRLTRQGVVGYSIDEPLSVIRVSENSISRNKLKQAARMWGLLRQQEGIGLFKAAYYFFLFAEEKLKKYGIDYQQGRCEEVVGDIVSEPVTQ